MDRLRQISQQLNPLKEWPDFKAGDTVKVSYKIKEGSKERTQVFQGTVIQRKGEGPTARHVPYDVGDRLPDECRVVLAK